MAVETPEIKLFGKWTYSDITVEDITLKDYIGLDKKAKVYLPHTAGRYQKKRFHKALCPIVERLMCSVMGKGRNNGKKLTALRIVEQTLDIINLVTGVNPLQVVVNAVMRGGAREDSTRIGSGGVVRRQAVDVAPLRRVNTAIGLICTGARNSAFRNIKSLAECLADELINCSGISNNGVPSANSFAYKKKDEVERVARANR